MNKDEKRKKKVKNAQPIGQTILPLPLIFLLILLFFIVVIVVVIICNKTQNNAIIDRCFNQIFVFFFF